MDDVDNWHKIQPLPNLMSDAWKLPKNGVRMGNPGGKKNKPQRNSNAMDTAAEVPHPGWEPPPNRIRIQQAGGTD